MSKEKKCLIILSTKSSGSSVLLRILSQGSHIRHIERTRHYENESLYWVKAASVLGLPQVNIQDSEVPIAAAKARHDLIDLIKDNVSKNYVPLDDRSLIFDGWSMLCEHLDYWLDSKSYGYCVFNVEAMACKARNITI